MNIKQRFILVLAVFVLASGCSSVGPESDAHDSEVSGAEQKQERAQESESLVPAPASKARIEELKTKKRSSGSDDMERLD
jgi:uncharacterized protein YceK